MSAGYLDLFVDQNATYNTSIILTDSNGNPENLTSFIVTANIKQSFITANIAAQFTVFVANTIGGVVNLSLDAPTTANLNPRIRYLYDVISLNTTTNIPSRVLQGTIYVSSGIT